MQKCLVSGESKKRAEVTKSSKGQKRVASILGFVTCLPSSVPHTALALDHDCSSSWVISLPDQLSQFVQVKLLIIPLSCSDLPHPEPG